jgi:hypothetical protein
MELLNLSEIEIDYTNIEKYSREDIMMQNLFKEISRLVPVILREF